MEWIDFFVDYGWAVLIGLIAIFVIGTMWYINMSQVILLIIGLIAGIVVGYKLRQYETYHFRTKTDRRGSNGKEKTIWRKEKK